MKLTYIHQYFATNEGTTGTRSFDVSVHLVRAGHRVTVVTGWSEQSGLPRPRGPIARYRIDGIDVVVCNVPYSNHQRVPERLLSWAGFAALASFVATVQPSDLIFATSTPPTVAIPARIASRLRRVPYVFEVRDLWPEDLVAAGRLRPGPQLALFEWLERLAYEKASRILLVSRGFHERLLERGLEAERLRTVVLGADGRIYEDVVPDRAFLAEHGLADHPVAVYAGAHGDANGLDQVLDAAELLTGSPLRILFVGAGKMRARLRADAARRGLDNVVFAEAVPKRRLPGVLAACDIGLMILKQIVRPRWVTPNKLFDYMFAGLPVVVNFAGTTADLVRDEGAGLTPQPGSAEALAAALRDLAGDPTRRETLGRRARAVAFAKYDRRAIALALAEEFAAVLES